tara:strand:- start:105 stop:416 length:312 start_codon:yes stop_codon:yes gene_type:complete
MNFKIKEYTNIKGEKTFQLDSKFFKINFKLFKEIIKNLNLIDGIYILSYDKKFNLFEKKEWVSEYNKTTSLAFIELSTDNYRWISIRSKNMSGYNHITKKFNN